MDSPSPVAQIEITIETTDDDLSVTDAIDPVILFWVGTAATVVLVVVLVWLKERFAGRTREARHAAHRAGFAYHGEDAKGVGRNRFKVFGDFDRMSISHQMSGATPRGTPVVSFDFCPQFRYLVTTDADGNKSRRRSRSATADGMRDPLIPVLQTHGSVEWVSEGSVRSGAVVGVPAWLPSLVIAPEGAAWKMYSRLTGLDLDTESEQFNRAYRVAGSDQDFARRFVTAPVIDALLHSDGELGLETFGDRILVFGSLRPPAELPAVALVAGMLREQVPDLVLHEYPRVGDDPGARGIEIPGLPST